LTIDKGYGVAEFQITARSELKDKTLAELALGQRDVTVLSIQRGSVGLTSPRGEERLRIGDHVLCFGKLLTLKQLIPTDRKGRRKRTKGDEGLPSVPPPEEDSDPGIT